MCWRAAAYRRGSRIRGGDHPICQHAADPEQPVSWKRRHRHWWACCVTAYVSARDALREWEAPIEWVLLAWGLLWWAGAAWQEIDWFVPGALQLSSLLLVLSASTLAAAIVARRWSWVSLVTATMAALPLVWLWTIAAFLDDADAGPLRSLGWIAWPAALVMSYVVLRFFEDVWWAPIARAGHVGTAWQLWFLVTWAVAAAVARVVPETPTWGQIAWPVLTSVLLVVFLRYGTRIAWPVQRHCRFTVPSCLWGRWRSSRSGYSGVCAGWRCGAITVRAVF